MIKEIRIAGVEISEERQMVLPGNGKINKVLIEFSNTDGLTQVQILTKQGEEVVKVINSSEKELFYPRIDVSRERYVKGETLNQEGAGHLEPFCFNGLLLRITRNSRGSNKVKRLVIVYEE